MLFCALLLSAHKNLAQKQGNVWMFIRSGLDFNTQTPQYFEMEQPLWGAECHASIADTTGQLLFYLQPSVELWTGGYYNNKGKIYNRFNEIIENGDGIYSFWSMTNGAIFLPLPGSNQYTYLFTLGAGQLIYNDISTPPQGCNYYVCSHLIDNFANDGKGKVIEKNKILYQLNFPAYSEILGLEEKLAAVRHANGRDWWLLTVDRKNCKFVRFLIQPQNILIDYAPLPFACPIDSSNVYTYTASLWGGEMVFSPDGTKLGYARYLSSSSGKLMIFDFDRCTGEIAHPKNLNLGMLPPPNNLPASAAPYGLAFSPKGTKLYRVY